MVATVDVIGVADGRRLMSFPSNAYGELAWSPDPMRIAVSGDSEVLVFDSTTGQRLKAAPMPTAGRIGIQYTNDGRYLIASDDQRGAEEGMGVRILDAQEMKMRQEIRGKVGSLAVSTDSKLLAVGDVGKTTVWKFRQL